MLIYKPRTPCPRSSSSPASASSSGTSTCSRAGSAATSCARTVARAHELPAPSSASCSPRCSSPQIRDPRLRRVRQVQRPAALGRFHLCAHGCAFARASCSSTFSTASASVVHDVYTQNFIMTSIGRKKIIYNISWEDPAIDHTVMHMTPEDDVVLTISSAGCNVLDYLCEGPEEDHRRGHELGAAARPRAQARGHPLRSPGTSSSPSGAAPTSRCSPKVYAKSKLRPLLAPRRRPSSGTRTPNLFRDNFMYAGTSGLMAKILCMPLIWSGVREKVKNREAPTERQGRLPLPAHPQDLLHHLPVVHLRPARRRAPRAAQPPLPQPPGVRRAASSRSSPPASGSPTTTSTTGTSSASSPPTAAPATWRRRTSPS